MLGMMRGKKGGFIMSKKYVLRHAQGVTSWMEEDACGDWVDAEDYDSLMKKIDNAGFVMTSKVFTPCPNCGAETSATNLRKAIRMLLGEYTEGTIRFTKKEAEIYARGLL
jgi:hypothetical protein